MFFPVHSYKSWKRRWFILNDNCLYYFEYTTDKEPRGIIPLENISVGYKWHRVGQSSTGGLLSISLQYKTGSRDPGPQQAALLRTVRLRRCRHHQGVQNGLGGQGRNASNAPLLQSVEFMRRFMGAAAAAAICALCGALAESPHVCHQNAMRENAFLDTDISHQRRRQPHSSARATALPLPTERE